MSGSRGHGRPPNRPDGSDSERPALDNFAHTVRGASQLLGIVAQSPETAPSLRAGLELLATTLGQTAQMATALIDEIGIDLSDQLGITTTDLAQMNFTPLKPPFHRQPPTVEGWRDRAAAEFTLWGAVESILTEDDEGLEHRFASNADEHLELIEALEKLRERWQGEVKLLEATLLRLAVAVARWEQSDGK